MKDATLSEFGTEGDESAESESKSATASDDETGETTSDASETTGSPDGAGEPTTDADETTTDAGETTAGVDDMTRNADETTGSPGEAANTDDPATAQPIPTPTVTARWDPDANCDDCGATVRRRWRQGGSFVCGDCKEWAAGE